MQKYIVGEMFLKCDKIDYFLDFPPENSAEGYNVISF